MKQRREYAPTDPSLPVARINNRRYLGNKYRLLNFIRSSVDAELPDYTTFADFFAGTGAVSSAFTDKTLVVNDLLYSNHICHVAWFSPEQVDGLKLEDLVRQYNDKRVRHDNYMSRTFADTFFSLQACRKIGFIREDIERRYRRQEVNTRERALLITSLLYAMDRIANTVGHYDAYLKGVSDRDSLVLAVPLPTLDNEPGNRCFNGDANSLAPALTADVAYLDPPYNSRQYSDAYHVLENVAAWKKPSVFGVARKMDRSQIKSDYCTVRAADAFAALVRSIDARLIVVSFSNLAEKGVGRSNAKLSDDDIRTALHERGDVVVHSQPHKAFTAGKSHVDGHEERLFICRVAK